MVPTELLLVIEEEALDGWRINIHCEVNGAEYVYRDIDWYATITCDLATRRRLGASFRPIVGHAANAEYAIKNALKQLEQLKEKIGSMQRGRMIWEIGNPT